MAKNYTTVARVASHLGAALSADQQAEAAMLIDAAEAWIDQRTALYGAPSNVWGTSTGTLPSATETREITGPYLYLRTPVASITSVTARPPIVGNAATTLLANSAYELVDAAQGALWFSSAYVGWEATVTFVPAAAARPVPATIVLAATKLVAFWLRPALGEAGGDVKSYSVGQELQVTYRDPAGGGVLGVPDDVVTLVDSAAGAASVGGGLVFA
jgi:hypothetical protein